MALFLLKRCATFILTLLAASIVVAAAQGLLPGNAAQVMLGESATPEAVAALSTPARLRPPGAGPLPPLGRGPRDPATSAPAVAYDTPIGALIVERLAVTVPLALMAMTLTAVLALVLGLFAASHHNRLGDVGVMTASQIGIACAQLLVRDPADPGVRRCGCAGFRPAAFRAGATIRGRAVKALILPAVALAVVQGGDPGAHHPRRRARGAARGFRAHPRVPRG